MQNPFLKIRRELDELKNEISVVRQFLAGLEQRMNSLVYADDLSGGGAPATVEMRQVLVGAGGDGGDLTAAGAYVSEDGAEDRATLEESAPGQTAVAGTDAFGDPPYALLANVCWVGKAGNNYWLLLNDQVTFATPGTDGVTADEWGNLAIKFGVDGNGVKRAYPVCVLAD